MQKLQPTGYGGSLQKKRQGRAHARPLSTSDTMHLVLRSTQAVGKQSFRTPRNFQKIEKLLHKFAQKYGIKVLDYANNHNHLHIHLKLTNHHQYRAFIRALTGAIATFVTKSSRLNPMKRKFWDRRPYTDIAKGLRYFRNLRNYIKINQLEGEGWGRGTAELAIKRRLGDFSLLRNFRDWVPI